MLNNLKCLTSLPCADLNMIRFCRSLRLQTAFIIFFCLFLEEILLDVSSESCARQRIHIKIKHYFLRKIKVNKIKFCLLQFLFGALRVNLILELFNIRNHDPKEVAV